jgi:hypothetical protein
MAYYIIATFMSVLISTFLRPMKKHKTVRREGSRLLIDKNSFNYYVIIFLSLVPLILISTLRYYVGTDYRTYMVYQIPAIISNRTDVSFEYLFQILVKFSVNTLKSPHWVFVIMSVLFILFVFGYIIHFSEDISFSIFLFVGTIFYNYSFNIIRQALATAIFLYALKFVLKRNMKKYLLYIAVASLIHTSAIIYFPFYFILPIPINKKFVPAAILILFIMQSHLRNGLAYICGQLGIYNSYFSSMFYTGNVTYYIVIVLNIFLLLVATYLVHEHSDEKPIIGNIYYNLLLITTIITVLSSIFPNNIRVIFMFFPILIVYLPYMIKRLKIIIPINLVKFICASFFIFFYLYFILHWNWGETLPYQTIFS